MAKANQGFATIPRRISSCMRNSIQGGICRITRPSAVAMKRTAIRPKSGTSTATSTRNAERTESTFPFHRKRSSGTETIQTAEITSALRRPTPSTHPIPCSVSHWGAPHEIHIGEWKVAPPAIILRHVRSADRSKLPTRTWNASRLLPSRLLRGPLSQRDPTSRTPCQGIMRWPSPRSAATYEQNGKTDDTR